MIHGRFKRLVLAAIDNITPKGEPISGMVAAKLQQPLSDWLDDLEDAVHQKLTPAEVKEDCGDAEEDDADDSLNVPEHIDPEEDT